MATVVPTPEGNWKSVGNTVSRQVSSPLGVVLAGFAKFDNEIRGCAPSGVTTTVRVLCSQWAARVTARYVDARADTLIPRYGLPFCRACAISPIPRYEV